jgi:ATP:ADP antiporter, AAA family
VTHEPYSSALIHRLVQVRPSELAAMWWAFAYFFCLLCGYYILRPVRDEMGIQGGLENLPWLFTATFIAMLVALPIFGWASGRFARRRLLPIVYLFFAANLLGFCILIEFRFAVEATARVFFIWLSVFNLFVVSVFWSFMADLFRNEQARRLYGFISAGGSLGALAGPSLTALLAQDIGPARLLLLSACMLLVATVCIERLGAWAATPGSRSSNGDPLGGSIFAGMTLALKSPYLLGIALYVVLGTALGTFLYFHQAHIVAERLATPGERTALFAQIDLAVNALTLICQLFLVNRLIQHFGLGFVLVLLPAIAVAGFLLIGFLPTLAVLIAFQVLRRAGEYAIARPSREILFTVLTREEKYKSKNFIDTVMFRGGDAVSGWLFAGLQVLGLGFAGIAFAAVPLAMVWAGTGWMLGRSQEEMRVRQEYLRRKHELQQSECTTPFPAESGSSDPAGLGQPAVR